MKQNFYLNALPKSEKKVIKLAAEVEGIDDEIVVLRLKIKTMLENEPLDLREMLLTTTTLGKLIKIRHSLSGFDHNDALAALDYMNKEYITPLGLSHLIEAISK